MRSSFVRSLVPALAAGLLFAAASRADLTDSLKKGTPDLKSAGALAFGPDGVLFVGDSQGAAVFALDTGDRTASKSADRPKVEDLDGKIASMVGIDAKQILLNDVAVNPISGAVYVSASRGKGPDAAPLLFRVDRASKIDPVDLKDIKFAKVVLPNPVAEGKSRQDAITHLAFVKNRVYIAGLSNEDFSSNLRSIAFPFDAADAGSSVEIFHGSHGHLETKSPVRTFVEFDVGTEPNLLAAYTCTPLVKIPVADLKPGQLVKGATIAELGAHNRPLDMIVYQKDGKDYLLMANSARGVMKVSLDGVAAAAPITTPVKIDTTAGLTYETIASLKGVEQLDVFDKEHALILVRTKADGPATLDTIELP
ncbi:MAG TPA: hypothetical protein VMS17_31060 [Gemmataceae bacterium]|nr:hypothetical protein [Gemmataceae bacterium]